MTHKCVIDSLGSATAQRCLRRTSLKNTKDSDWLRTLATSLWFRYKLPMTDTVGPTTACAQVLRHLRARFGAFSAPFRLASSPMAERCHL